MRILAFTDLHENTRALERIKQAAKSVDLVLCVGDFTIFGRSMKRMLTQLNSLGVPVVLIHGNHEDEEEVTEHLDGLQNIHFVHLQVLDLMGLRFMGFGGHGFSRREQELEAFEKASADKFNERTVFLCHAPPYGTTLDEVSEDWHVGNESLTQLIRRRKPMLVLAGHIHECFHAHDTLGSSVLINPGPDGEIIEVEND
jgi:uncharacterized protein